jgi:hypothetical protein
MNGLELRSVNISIAIAISQVEDAGSVLPPLIGRISAIVIQIPYVRRGYNRIVVGVTLRDNGINYCAGN